MNASVKKQKAVPLRKKQNPEAVSKPNHFWFYLAALIALIFGTYQAYALKWVGDDIFIGFRYIDNFLNGDGWVYNIGEHVEGYTNYLWLVIIAFFQKINFDPVNVSINLGIICFFAVLVIFGFISYKVNASFKNKLFIPFTLILLALNQDFAIWATSGLETSFYTLLMSGAFYIYFFTDIKRPRKLLSAGFLLSLSMITRPDSLMFAGLACFFVLLRSVILKNSFKKTVGEILLFSLPMILIYVPYFIWRYQFYGYPFPNTYYSKLAYLTSFDKGFYYIWLYIRVHYITVLVLFSIIPVYRWLLKENGSLKQKIRSITEDRLKSVFVFSLTCVSLYWFLFIAKVGGDFMYARFMVPTLPFIYLLMELTANYILPSKRYAILTAILVMLSFHETKLRKELFIEIQPDGTSKDIQRKGIADERYFYVNLYKLLKVDKPIGQMLSPYFKNIGATMHVRGAQACLCYYLKIKAGIENHGLTDEYIAHLPVTIRGEKVAHEHEAPWDYLVKRGCDFSINRSPKKKEQQYRVAMVQLNGMQIPIGFITYHRNVVKQLKQNLGANFLYTDFEALLDQYIKTDLFTKSKDDLQKDYKDFKEFYFMHNDDQEREQKFIERLAALTNESPATLSAR